MPTILGQLTHATNVLRHGLEDRIVETGLYVSEYLVLRAADSNPDATAADVRRALGMRDAAFSDLVGRAVGRGYVTLIAAPMDLRTRSLRLTLTGQQAIDIAAGIHRDLESHLGAPRQQLAIYRQLDGLGRVLDTVPRVAFHSDGLPLDTV